MSPRDPERSIERLLRQPPAGADHQTTACLDAETIAAWYEGSLSSAARQKAETHLADCARCQAIVGDVVRAAAAAGVVPARRPRRVFAWLVPLTTAAAAVAIWIALPEQAKNPSPVQQPPGAAVRSVPEPAASPTVPPSPSAEIAGAREAVAPPPGAPPAADPTLQDAPLARQEAAPLRERASAQPALKADARADAGGAADAAAPPAARAASSPASAAAQSTPPPAAAVDSFETVATFRRATPPANLVAVPNSPVRWRTLGPAVERSSDEGGTWERVFTADVTLAALAAPTPSVCWLVGPGGSVFRSTDGRSFSRLPFPEPLDLSVVRATDAAGAAVATLDGRTFTTRDGGTTWTRR